MKSRFRSLLVPSLALLLVSLFAVASLGADDRPDFDGWFEGADGLRQAIEVQKETRKPMFVYFYTDWCGYCRQFERVLLKEEVVDDYLDDIIAVRIDAEGGPLDSRVARMYGVSGYPGLFMHSNRTKTVSQVTRMERTSEGGARLLEGPDFVRVLENAASR